MSTADADPAFDVAITGGDVLDHDFNELSTHDLRRVSFSSGYRRR